MLKISDLYNKAVIVESEDKDWNDKPVEDIKEEIDKVGPTPLDWLEYIIDRENISAPVTKNPKEIISSLNVLMDSIGYAQQSDIHAVEYFIGDNPKVFSMIVNFIKDVIEHEKSNHIDFSQALETAIKNNYKVEISDNVDEDTIGSVVTNEDELWEVIEDEFDNIKDMTKEEILEYITDTYPVSEPKIETINNVWDEYQIYKEKRINDPTYREGIGSKNIDENDTENEVKEFNKKRDELETDISNAENELFNAKQKEDKELIKSAKQKLNNAWKALNDFDEDHFEASNNVD